MSDAAVLDVPAPPVAAGPLDSEPSARLERFRSSVIGLRTRGPAIDGVKALRGVGLALLAFGPLVILVAWAQAADVVRGAEQLPYVISGAIFGSTVAAAGGIFFATAIALGRLRDRGRLHDGLSRGFYAVAERVVRTRAGDQVAARAPELVRTRHGSLVHRASCVVLRGTDEVVAARLGDGRPCGICEPGAAAVDEADDVAQLHALVRVALTAGEPAVPPEAEAETASVRRRQPWRPKTADDLALVVACIVGLVLSIGLLLAEAGKTDPLEVGELRERRRGEVSRVVFDVRNQTDRALCPEIRVAARDLEAKDLAEVVARPAAAGGRIPPGRAARYTADLEIDRQDYEEELDEIRAYVYEERSCP